MVRNLNFNFCELCAMRDMHMTSTGGGADSYEKRIFPGLKRRRAKETWKIRKCYTKNRDEITSIRRTSCILLLDSSKARLGGILWQLSNQCPCGAWKGRNIGDNRRERATGAAKCNEIYLRPHRFRAAHCSVLVHSHLHM